MKPPAVYVAAILAAIRAAVFVLCILGVAAVVVLSPSCSGPGVTSGTFEIDTVTFELDQGRSGKGMICSGRRIIRSSTRDLSHGIGGSVTRDQPVRPVIEGR